MRNADARLSEVLGNARAFHCLYDGRENVRTKGAHAQLSRAQWSEREKISDTAIGRGGKNIGSGREKTSETAT